MATNFGNTIMEGGITPSVQVQQPVQDRTGEVLGKALQPVAATVGSIFGQMVAGQQQSAKDAILNDFNNRLLDYADAMDQGASRDAVMLNVRNLTRQYLNDHPALRDDINSLYATVTGASGMANIIREGTIEDQVNETIAINAGQLGITEDQYRRNLSAQQQLLELNNRWNALQAQGGIIDEEMEAEGRDISRNYIASLYPIAQSRLAQAMREAENNPAQKAQIMGDAIIALNAEITQAEALAGTFNADSMLNPIRNLIGVAQDWAAGSTETTLLQGQIDNVSTRANATLRLDPEIADTLARVKIFSDAGLPEPLMMQLNSSRNLVTLVDVVRPNDDDPPIRVDGSQRSAEQVAMVDSLVRNSNSMGEEAQAEVYQALNNLIEAVYTGERTITDPVELKNIVEVIASEDAKRLIDKFGGISSSAAQGAAQVIENHYNRVLIPAINDAWFDEQAYNRVAPSANGAIVYTYDNPPEAEFYSPSQIADPIWNGSAVQFVVKPEFADDANIIQNVETLNTGNNSIAIPLNNTINAMANLSGVEPRQIWEQNMQNRLFGGVAGERDEFLEDTRRVVDELMGYAPMNEGMSLEDFQGDSLQLESIDPSTVPALAAIENIAPLDAGNFIDPNTNPAVDPVVLSSYAGRRLPVSIRNNNMGAISITGSIENSWAARQPGFVGTSPRPANEGGYYAKYATPEHGVAAASRLLENYGRQGVNTPLAIVTKWSADRSAHATYANTLVRYLNEAGVSASSGSRLDLSNPMVRFAILKAKSAHESGAGRPVYNDEVFLRGVSYNV